MRGWWVTDEAGLCLLAGEASGGRALLQHCQAVGWLGKALEFGTYKQTHQGMDLREGSIAKSNERRRHQCKV